MIKKCNPNSDKIRLLSSCEKPVFTRLCNLDELAQAVGNDNTGMLQEIRDAIINNTAVLKSELDEMQTAVTSTIQEVITAIDDGIEVTATQAGQWTVEVSNPTDLDALAGKIATALDGLNVTVAGQSADLNVNVVNDRLVVTVDNFPTPVDYTSLLTEIRDKKDYEYVVLYDKVEGTGGGERVELFSYANQVVLSNSGLPSPSPRRYDLAIDFNTLDLTQPMELTVERASGFTALYLITATGNEEVLWYSGNGLNLSIDLSSIEDIENAQGLRLADEDGFTNWSLTATALGTATEATCTPFIRHFEDGVVGDYALDGTAYTVQGEVATSCGATQDVNVTNEKLTVASDNANNYAEYTNGQTITGTNIVVAFYEGSGTFSLNGGGAVKLDANSQYRTEAMDGTVVISPTTESKYHVSWRA